MNDTSRQMRYYRRKNLNFTFFNNTKSFTASILCWIMNDKIELFQNNNCKPDIF